MLAFTASIATSEGTPSQNVFNDLLAQVLWILFAGFIVYKTIFSMDKYSGTEALLALLLAIVSLIVAFYGIKKFRKMMRRRTEDEIKDKSTRTTDLAAVEEANEARKAEIKAGEAGSLRNKRIEGL